MKEKGEAEERDGNLILLFFKQKCIERVMIMDELFSSSSLKSIHSNMIEKYDFSLSVIVFYISTPMIEIINSVTKIC